MRYTVQFSSSGRRDLARLSDSMRGRLLRGIETLEENPRRFGTKLLKGELKGMRRLRVGDYRVTYVISDAAHTVEIMHIGHRESFYDR